MLQHGKHAVLVDTGPPDAPVVAGLRRLGIHRLDVLVLTHAQTDHDGSAPAVLASTPTQILLDGRDGVPETRDAAVARALRDRATRRVVPDRGQVIVVGPIALHVLSPRREPAAWHAGADPNDRAIVIEARSAGTRVLLAADAESGVLEGLEIGAVDVLKVAHHGSEDPGLPALLQRLTPRIAVVSAGARNPFGHPRRTTMQALHAAVPQVLRTDLDGTVVLEVSPRGTAVRTLR